MLAISVEFLTGCYYAGSYDNRNQPEWPPHPGRIYSAMVSAHFRMGASADTLAALHWLENQPAPSISCSDAEYRKTCISYVPVNDEISMPKQRNRQPRSFPCALPHNPKIQFIWANQPPQKILSAIEKMLSGVAYLGTSRSPVCIGMASEISTPTFQPVEFGGDAILRIPSPGRFEQLCRIYDYKLGNEPGQRQFYQRINNQKTSDNSNIIEPGYWGNRDFHIFTLDGARLSLDSTLNLTHRIRKALLALAGGNAPGALHGHAHSSHCAFIPLPFVKFHQHADGHIPGFAVVLPDDLRPEDRNSILVALSKFTLLTFPGGREYQVTSAIGDQRKSLNADTWLKPSCVWDSVTPVVLDRHPKKQPGKSVADIIRTACLSMNLPEPFSIEYHQHSHLTGVISSTEFTQQRTSAEQRRPAFHVRLTFNQPVRGPLMIGAKRFFGLGLFLPADRDA